MTSKKVLIGCETSGTVREAFLELGFDTWSCDILPSDIPTNRHILNNKITFFNDKRCKGKERYKFN